MLLFDDKMQQYPSPLPQGREEKFRQERRRDVERRSPLPQGRE